MTIEEQIPWLASASRRKRWLAGISGGADSVALLHLLHEAGFREVVVCHLDHRLRGRASAGDAKFVQKLAEGLGYRVETGRADVRALMGESGDSMEAAARAARHAFFANCARRHRCPRIVLAHHLDDQAETVLWNLLRGSRGLKGMREVREMEVAGTRLELIRPLLGVRGGALREWLAGKGLRWREDASNGEPVAVRNRLRNEAFPLLREICGRDVSATLARGAADARDLEEVEKWALDQAHLMDPRGRLHLPSLRKLPRPVQCSVIRRYLAEQGIGGLDRALLDRCLALLDVKDRRC